MSISMSTTPSAPSSSSTSSIVVAETGEQEGHAAGIISAASGTFAVACPFSTVLSELGAQLNKKSRPPVNLVVTPEKVGVTSQTAQIEK
jgi:hypothetical protein